MKFEVCVNDKVITSCSKMKRAEADYEIVRKALNSVIIGEDVNISIFCVLEVK